MEYLAKCVSCGVMFDSRPKNAWKRPKKLCSARCSGLAGWAATGAAAISAQRDALIKALMSTETDSTIAALLGTSRTAIAQRRQRLRLLHQQPVLWSEGEKRMLADMAPSMSNSELSELLGRSAQSIGRCLKRNGISRPPTFYLERGQPFNDYPPELQEVIRLHNKVKRRLRDEEHRRSA